MKKLIELADRGLLPDRLIRIGIRRLNRMRLREEDLGGEEEQLRAAEEFIDRMQQSPIALQTHKANEQHYEMPPDFFEHVLGRHLKYSGCYWPQGINSLDEAEAEMLQTTSRRAELKNGLRILELGCGWGSLSLWMAGTFPDSRITAVSNSKPQRQYIKSKITERNLQNLQVITADMNDFSIDRRFDRVVSVEMFEHMRNWPRLLERISNWLTPDGKLFIHIFSHQRLTYAFEETGDDNWMGKYFFSGGMMPSDGLLLRFQDHMNIEEHWQVNGKHYSRTAEAWLVNLDKNREKVMPIMRDVYGRENADIWFQRWRIFFMACAELWGFRDGKEWLVSHYLLKKK